MAGHPAVNLAFRTPDGEVIPPNPKTRSRGNVREIVAQNKSNGFELHRLSLQPDWLGESFDYVTALIHLARLHALRRSRQPQQR